MSEQCEEYENKKNAKTNLSSCWWNLQACIRHGTCSSSYRTCRRISESIRRCCICIRQCYWDKLQPADNIRSTKGIHYQTIRINH